MALIICKDCKKEFSTDAKACPHCGANKPVAQNQKKTTPPFVVFLLVIIGIISVLSSIGEIAKTPEQKAAEAQKDFEEKGEYKLLGICETLISQSLIDPESAKITYGDIAHDNGVISATFKARATNAFNAKRNLYFYCSVERNGSDWQLKDFSEKSATLTPTITAEDYMDAAVGARCEDAIYDKYPNDNIANIEPTKIPYDYAKNIYGESDVVSIENDGQKPRKVKLRCLMHVNGDDVKVTLKEVK